MSYADGTAQLAPRAHTGDVIQRQPSSESPPYGDRSATARDVLAVSALGTGYRMWARTRTAAIKSLEAQAGDAPPGDFMTDVPKTLLSFLALENEVMEEVEAAELNFLQEAYSSTASS